MFAISHRLLPPTSFLLRFIISPKCSNTSIAMLNPTLPLHSFLNANFCLNVRCSCCKSSWTTCLFPRLEHVGSTPCYCANDITKHIANDLRLSHRFHLQSSARDCHRRSWLWCIERCQRIPSWNL